MRHFVLAKLATSSTKVKEKPYLKAATLDERELVLRTELLEAWNPLGELEHAGDHRVEAFLEARPQDLGDSVCSLGLLRKNNKNNDNN